MRAAMVQTFMEALAPVAPVTGADAAAPRGAAPAALPASLAGGGATLEATILGAPREGRLTIALAEGIFDVEIPPALARRLAAGELQPGRQVQIRLEAQNGQLRLALLAPAPEAPPPVSPRAAATLVTLSAAAAGTAAGPSVAAAPPLATPFPPGSLGAAVSRLAGLPLPLGERQSQPLPAALAPRAPLGENGAARALLRGFPPELAEAARHAARLALPLGPAIARLLASPVSSPALHPALAALAAQRLDATATPDAGSLADAVRRSGIFLEAGLARRSPGDALPPPVDLKAALLKIAAALPQVADDKAPSRAALADQASQSIPPRALPRAGGIADGDLPRLVEGAIERVKIFQLASLPDRPELTITDDRSQTMRLALAVPIATRGPEHPETATIGLLVEHRRQTGDEPPAELDEPDDDGTAESARAPWLVRIALDLDETGPVQAEIALRGQSVGVTLWAERKETAGLCRSAIGDLHQALSDAAFEVTRLQVKDGRPLGLPARAAAQLDRRT